MRITKIKSDKKVRTIVFSFDEKYAKYFSVVLVSLIRYADKDYVYDLIVLYDSLSDQTIQKLQKLVPDGFSLRFFNVSDCAVENFGDLSGSIVEGKWVISTFYDLLIPLIMPDYEYVLYCDSDIVFQDDPGNLFETSLNSRPFAAAQDSFSLSFALNPEDKFLLNQAAFLHNTLEITNPKKYFNTGVILFHIPSIDKEEYIKKVQVALSFPELPTVDQDVLNYVFKDNTVLVPLRFNLQAPVLGQLKNRPDFVQANPEAEELLEVSQTPAIVHYTTHNKPWLYPNCELGYCFWKEAKRSPFFTQIISENISVKQKGGKYLILAFFPKIIHSVQQRLTQRKTKCTKD